MRVLGSHVNLSVERKVTSSSSQQVSAQAWVGPPPTSTTTPSASRAGTGGDVRGAKQCGEAEDRHGGGDIELVGDERKLHDLLLLTAVLTGDLDGARRAVRNLREMRAAYQGHGGGGASLAAASPAAPAANGAAGPPPSPVGWGATLDAVSISTRTETLHVAATVEATTSQGSVSLGVTLDLEHTESMRRELHLRAGDARRVDPLVVNLDGTAASFSGRQSFDLDADGTSEEIPLLDAGHAYLAIDRNGNGTIDDGRELFGPGSGNGFAELAALDGDHNGWLDEGDAAFSQLKLWSPRDPGQLRNLSAEKIGALYTRAVSTTLATKDANASATATSVFLREDARGGTLEDVDFLIAPGASAAPR